MHWNWESRFDLGLNAAKNTDYIKSASNESCSELNFLQNVSGHVSPSISPGVEQRSPKITLPEKYLKSKIHLSKRPYRCKKLQNFLAFTM